MQLGIFARTFAASSLQGVLDAVVDHGLSAVHFNLGCAGMPSLPGRLESDQCDSIHKAFQQRGLEMVGISGTFNAIHPDRQMRRSDIEKAVTLIRGAKALGTSFVSLCTGTRDPGNIWKAHPENSSTDAWSDLRETLDRLLEVAHEEAVDLGIEPERANVVDSAPAARKILDEVGSPHLRIILDGANLSDRDAPDAAAPLIREAFDLLGSDIAQVHAKEIPAEEDGALAALGSGRLDWDTYFECMRDCRYSGPVVIHNLLEGDVGAAVHFLQKKAAGL